MGLLATPARSEADPHLAAEGFPTRPCLEIRSSGFVSAIGVSAATDPRVPGWPQDPLPVSLCSTPQPDARVSYRPAFANDRQEFRPQHVHPVPHLDQRAFQQTNRAESAYPPMENTRTRD